jgi:8-oxo-dGTP pyrophosphatase MutT (NUDIX family)
MPISAYLANLRSKIGNDLILMPGVNAIVFNDAGEVLLQHAHDGRWYTPGGAMDPHEQPADACAREVLEESGLIVEPQHLVGIFTEAPVTYPNGDLVQYVAIAFACRVIGGKLKVGDDESRDMRFFPTNQLPPLREDQRERLEQARAGMSGLFRIDGSWRSSRE